MAAEWVQNLRSVTQHFRELVSVGAVTRFRLDQRFQQAAGLGVELVGLSVLDLNPLRVAEYLSRRAVIARSSASLGRSSNAWRNCPSRLIDDRLPRHDIGGCPWQFFGQLQ